MPSPDALASSQAGTARASAPASFIITPHQSLSDNAALVLYAALLMLGIAIQLPALTHGWWPVSMFVSLDVAGAILVLHVFRLCQRHRREEIEVADGTISIRRFAFRSAMTEQHLPCYGLSVWRCDDPDVGCRRLILKRRKQSVEIARDLSPFEREALSTAFVDALRPYSVPLRIETGPGWALLTKGPYAP